MGRKTRFLTDEILKTYGVTYVANPESPEAQVVPDYVKALKDELLDFNAAILRQDVENILGPEELAEIPRYAESRPLPHHIWVKQDREEDPNIKLAIDLMSKIYELENKMPPERDWTLLLRKSVFKELEHSPGRLELAENGFGKSDCDVSIVSFFWRMYGRSYHENHLSNKTHSGGEDTCWNESDNARERTPGIIGPTHPKPDIYLGFRMHDGDYQHYQGFKRLPYFQNFTVQNLDQLADHGLISSPTSTFRKVMFVRKTQPDYRTICEEGITAPKRIAEHQRICFPWAIVEVKPDEVSTRLIDKCYRQAANAASMSLCLFEKLAKYADVQYEAQHILPVVTFTFVGPEVRLWIAFSTPTDDGHRNHKMVCVWKGNIKTFWGAFQLYQIVDKVYFWGLRVVKPQVSTYLDQWRQRHITGVSVLRSILANQRHSELLKKLNRVDERLRSFSIGNSRLDDLIMQMIVQEELKTHSTAVESSDATSPDVYAHTSSCNPDSELANAAAQSMNSSSESTQEIRKESPDTVRPRARHKKVSVNKSPLFLESNKGQSASEQRSRSQPPASPNLYDTSPPTTPSRTSRPGRTTAGLIPLDRTESNITVVPASESIAAKASEGTKKATSIDGRSLVIYPPRSSRKSNPPKHTSSPSRPDSSHTRENEFAGFAPREDHNAQQGSYGGEQQDELGGAKEVNVVSDDERNISASVSTVSTYSEVDDKKKDPSFKPKWERKRVSQTP